MGGVRPPFGGRSIYDSSSRTARSSAPADGGLCRTCLMPSSAARRFTSGSTIAVIIIVGTYLPRVFNSETNSRPFRPGIQ